jgi:LysR family transcriptional regulator of abg operon
MSPMAGMFPLKLHQLRYLIAIAEQGSIRAAARALGVTQGAVTQAARELEENCGLALFIRRSGGVALTPAGRDLLLHARIVVKQLANAQADMDRRRNVAAATRLSIAVTPWVTISLLPQALRRFHLEAPQVQLEIFDGLSGVALPKLREGGLDLAIGRLPVNAEISADLHCTPVFNYQAAVVAREGHPRRDARSIAELLDCDWLLTCPPQEEKTWLDELFTRHGLAVPAGRIHLAHSLHLSLGLMTHSDMFGFWPCPLIESFPGGGQLRALRLREAFKPHTLGIVRRQDDAPSWAAQRFLDHFFREAKAIARSDDPTLKRVFQTVEVLI